MATPAEFAARMKRLAGVVRTNSEAGWRATALVVVQTLVTSTPVDTGRARSNWQVGDGTPPVGVKAAFAAGTKGSTGGPNASAAIEEAKQRIAKASSGTLYVTNNLPYIVPLNQGHSAQAPAGFVETAINVGIAYAKKLRLLKGA